MIKFLSKLHKKRWNQNRVYSLKNIIIILPAPPTWVNSIADWNTGQFACLTEYYWVLFQAAHINWIFFFSMCLLWFQLMS